MAERRVVGNILPSWLGKRTPSPNVATTMGARWIDGTAGGSTTNTTYGFYAITGVGNMSYQIVDGAVTLSATNATGRGRVMTSPFEATTTQQNINQYAYRIRPSTSYTFSCNAKGTDLISNTARVNVLLFNSSGALVSTKSLSYIPSGTTDYAAYSTTFTSESTASFAVVQCIFTTAGAVMSASFKDFQLDTTTPTTRTTVTSRTTVANRVAVRDMGTALRFDGVDDYVAASAIAAIQQGNPTTISMWFNISDDGDGTLFANRIGTTTQNLHFGYRSSARRIEGAFFTAGAPNLYYGCFTSPRLDLAKWYHFVLVYDGTTLNQGTNGTDHYINGVLQNRASSNFGGSGSVDGLSFGAQTNGTTSLFKGTIDEPRIWNRALTATEIQNLYLYGVAPRDGLVAEYLFDEASGTTALNSSGNGNDGTISGATYTLDVPLVSRNTV